MANLDQLLQEYVNRPYDELMGLARASMGALSSDMSAIFGDDGSVANAYLIITAACFGVDMKFSTLEYTFLKELIGSDLNYNDMKNVIQGFCGTDSMDLTNRLADSLSRESKSTLLIFCLCLLSVDETITREETAFLVELMKD